MVLARGIVPGWRGRRPGLARQLHQRALRGRRGAGVLARGSRTGEEAHGKKGAGLGFDSPLLHQKMNPSPRRAGGGARRRCLGLANGASRGWLLLVRRLAVAIAPLGEAGLQLSTQQKCDGPGGDQ